MLNQIVQWIFLPGGFTEDRNLAASIFVAPRLRGDGSILSLSDFPDFVDWPAIVRGGRMRITLQRGDGTTEAPMRIINTAGSALWQAFFLPETRVRPFVFDDLADRPLVTYPLRRVLGYLQDKWATLAEMTIEDLPFSSLNASPIGPAIGGEQLDGRTLSTHFGSLIAANRIGIFEGSPGADIVAGRMKNVLRSAAVQAAALHAQHKTRPQPLIQPFDQGDTHAGNFYQLACFHRRPILDPGEFPQGSRDCSR